MRLKAIQTLVFGAAVAFVHGALAGPVTYNAIDLNTLGLPSVTAEGISGNGTVTGHITLGPLIEPFVYSNGIMTPFADFGGAASGVQTFGEGVNDTGQVVGIAGGDAFLYSNGTYTNLGAGQAYGINNSGQVTGYFYEGGANLRAFLYSGGVSTSLGTSEPSSRAAAINDSGQIAGSLGGNASYDAAIFSGGGITDLGNLGTGDADAWGISNNGQVAGFAGNTTSEAYVYSNGVMTLLGTLGGAESYAHSVDDSGFVVGYSDDPQDNDHAFVYEYGTLYDLNDLVVSGLDPGAVLTEATAINDNGWIVVNATVNGNNQAFLLEPTPEPGTVALMILGAGALAFRRWRQQ